MNYEAVREYVRRYNVDTGYDYDANGVVHLLLAALDNMREHFHESDLDAIAYALTDEQRAFLRLVADSANRKNDAEIELESED